MFKQIPEVEKIWNNLSDDFHRTQMQYLDQSIHRLVANPELRFAICEVIDNIVTNDSNEQFIYENFLTHIISSDEDASILVQGKQGTGKSTFLSMLWFDLLLAYSVNREGIFPCYIDLHFYDMSTEEEAVEQLKSDLHILRTSVESLKPHRLFFILDGIDAYRRDLSSLQKTLFDHIDEYQFRTICLGSAESILHNLDQKQGSNWLQLDYSMRLTVRSIPRREKTKLHIVEGNISKIFANTQNVSEDAIIVTAMRYSSHNVDFRTLILITKIADSNIEISPDKFGCALLEYYKRLFNESDLIIEAQYAALYQFGIIPEIESETPKILRHKNRLVRDFLTAYDFHCAIINYDSKANKSRALAFCRLRQSFAVTTNRFLKDLYGTLSHNASYRYTENMISLLGLQSTSPEMRSQLVYMLGRVKSDGEKTKARKTLSKLWGVQFNSLFFQRSILIKDSKVSAASLVLLRTTAVSLLILGYTDHTIAYIKCLLYNDRMMELNRAFHLHYYDDQEQRLEELDYTDDNTHRFDTTYMKLMQNIESAISSGKFSYQVYLDIITLYSFSTSRLSILSNSEINELITLADRILTSKNNRNHLVFKLKPVRSYVSLSKNVLSKKDSFIVDTIAELYQMKKIRRSGWVRRNVESPESVADHTLYCIMLAIILLPQIVDSSIYDESSYRDYSKSKIIKMLTMHDVGEIATGDIITSEKKQLDKEREIECVRYYGMLTTLPNLFGFADYADIYEEYENMENINAMIAKDIDVIESYIQACLYSSSSKDISIEEWRNYAVSTVQSELGKDIMEYIDKHITAQLERRKTMTSTIIKPVKKDESSKFTSEEIFWIHMSDIHYDPENDVTNTKIMLSKLIEQLPELITSTIGSNKQIDILVFTGDYRFAKVQKEATVEKDAEAAAGFIKVIAQKIGTSIDNVLIVPGNHDLNQEHQHIRDILIEKLYSDYIANIRTRGKLQHNDLLHELMDGFSYFRILLSKLYGPLKGNAIWQQWYDEACLIVKHKEIQFLLLNTALFSGKAKPKDEMAYCWGYP